MLCRFRPLSASTETYIAAYFEWFHPSFPLIHQPTFGNDTPEALRNIIIAIGCLYTARALPEEGSASCVKLSKNLWDTGRRSLARLVSVPSFVVHVFIPNMTFLTFVSTLGELRLERATEDMDHAGLVTSHHLRCLHGQCLPV